MGVQDEATFGLIPNVARGWARKGSRPITNIEHIIKCTNVFGARSKKSFVFSFTKKKGRREFVRFLGLLRKRLGRVLLFVDNYKPHKVALLRNISSIIKRQ